MRALGSWCGHEDVFNGFRKNLTIKRPNRNHPITTYDGDSSFKAAPFIGNLAGIPVLLLIRNPLDVTRSLMMTKRQKFLSDEFIESGSDLSTRLAMYHLSMPDTDRLGRILTLVAQWDVGLTGLPDVKAVRVEDINEQSLESVLIHLLGFVPSLDDRRRAIASTDRYISTHNGDQSSVSWGDIENHPYGGAVVAKAKRWGYL